jgi:hypothetical protein
MFNILAIVRQSDYSILVLFPVNDGLAKKFAEDETVKQTSGASVF